MFNLSRFYRFHRLFAGQAFESNGGVSVTVMDGEEMVGRMADQVLIIFPCRFGCLIRARFLFFALNMTC